MEARTREAKGPKRWALTLARPELVRGRLSATQGRAHTHWGASRQSAPPSRRKRAEQLPDSRERERHPHAEMGSGALLASSLNAIIDA